ncbi:hypothetical protein DERF_009749 [Dermatophagoides farinae]|uniref:Uncharacterized protein n=1 Tax=Dermatophagoides farinae TaxID=6954 RepID=A0A922L2V3_DERFA|nr:hypothetical protein DERF_009749 [Dermatophagoides farinae]
MCKYIHHEYFKGSFQTLKTGRSAVLFQHIYKRNSSLVTEDSLPTSKDLKFKKTGTVEIKKKLLNL